jgi:IS30 family transposase
MGHLTEVQRYGISVMQDAGMSRKEICKRKTGRDKSLFVSWLRRHCDGRTGKYNPGLAQRKYEKRVKEKPKFIHFTQEVKRKATGELQEDFSPGQIAGRARLGGEKCVGHETVYRYVWKIRNRAEIYINICETGVKNIKSGKIIKVRAASSGTVSVWTGVRQLSMIRCVWAIWKSIRSPAGTAGKPCS